jgi:hypothetical protein
MSKGVRAVLIGIVVAFVLSFGLAYFYAAAGEPDTPQAVLVGCVFGAITAYIFGNLAGNRSIANASDAQKREALARAPEPGKALLYLYREGFVAKLAGLNLSIDGRVVAQLKAPRFTLVVVPARQVALSAAFGGLAGPQNKKSEIVLDASAGGIVVVRITMAMGMLQGSVTMKPQPDPAAARQRLASFTMTPAEVPEV